MNGARGATPPPGGIAAALATLKDVSGIAGSFVFTTTGKVFAREMHPMFDDEALDEAAERLTRLRDTFAAVGDHLELAVIRYHDHRLYLKVLDMGMLCILADGVVNMAALRMAASLVARRIDGAPHVQRVAVAPVSPRASGSFPDPLALAETPGPDLRRPPSMPSHSSTPVAPPAAASGTRRFRGRTV